VSQQNDMVTGYLHPDYAQSLADFGTPRCLEKCGGWILDRPIMGFSYRDAMGCYPLFACQDWQQLHADLETVGDDLVSLSLVADPFGEHDAAYLQQCFPDVSRPFKEHFVVDLDRPLSTFVSKHHRRYAQKALQTVHVERCQAPVQFLDDWVDLYATLIERHSIKGVSAFSKSAFAKQLQIPGIVAFRASHQDATVGMILWYTQREVSYYHLGAYSTIGYELRASFALFWRALEHFGESGLRWLNLGAGAGATSNGTDGLSRFKRGWSTGTRTAYFCGRIFDRAKYSEIVKARQVPATGYFPAYRLGEFA
jgi:hypothetical protein